MDEARHAVLDDGRVIFRYLDPASAEAFAVVIHCPLPSRCHAAHQDLLAPHRQWPRQFDLLPVEANYQRYCDTRLDLLAAYQCHNLPLAAALRHSHLMSWFFVFDDLMDIDHQLDDTARALLTRIQQRHLAVLDGANPDDGDSPCVRAFADFLQQAASAGGPDGWQLRLKHHLREYIAGAIWESRIGPTTGQNSNTAFYLQVRHLAVGVAPCLDLMASAAGIDLRPIESNFFIQRLERLAINYSIWVNDLAGLNRDLRRRLGNVIFTLQQDHNWSLPEATRQLARMCDGELAAFRQVEDQLPMLLGDDYVRHQSTYDAYTTLLKHWMRGLLDWSARSDRYRRLDVDMALQNDRSIRQATADIAGSPSGRQERLPAH